MQKTIGFFKPTSGRNTSRRMAALVCALTATLGLSAQKVAAPEPILPIPQPKQVEWQKREQTAFIHFGLNTFNDREWGYGDSELATFNPKKLDCEQWVRILKQAGMKEVILTAKHHDGFCLWPSPLTPYSIRNTPYKNGEGNIVGDLEKACRKYGLELGIYLSPWDRNSRVYATPDYVKYYHAQLRDLLSNYGKVVEVWFDGANGGDGWYGGAKEKRTIDRKHYYDYPTIYNMIDSLQPDAIVFGDGGPGCRWVGNERGFAGETNWSFLHSNTVFPGYDKYYELTYGHAEGDQWTPAECDVSIRPGWFWHETEDNKVRSAANLTDLYYKSVGRNGLMLLNIPPNRDGLISPQDSANVVDFHKNIMAELANDLLPKAKVKTTANRGKGFEAKRMTDGNYDSYWATPDGVTTATVTYTFGKATKLNRLMLQEYIPLGQRVKSFTVEYVYKGKKQVVPVSEQTTTIGYKRLLRFPTITADQLIIRFDEARGPLCINRIGAFFADTPIARGEGLETTSQLPESYQLKFEGADATEAKKATDRNVETTAFFDGKTVTIDLGEEKNVTTLCYLPDQATPAQGTATHYRVTAIAENGTKTVVASGEFSNIKSNPILQTVRFTPTKARRIVFEATALVDGGNNIGVAEVTVH